MTELPVLCSLSKFYCGPKETTQHLVTIGSANSSQKSSTQKTADNMRSGCDDASNQSKGLAQSVTDSVNYATQSMKETLGGSSNQPKKA